MSLLEWTGNPFVDGGIAAILAYCKKRKPEDVTQDDLRKMSEVIKASVCYTCVEKSFSLDIYRKLSVAPKLLQDR